MREIRTSGLMSGEGKRSDANAVQTTAPFLDSTANRWCAKVVPDPGQPPLQPHRLDLLEALSIHPRRALVGPRQSVGMEQDVFAIDLVVEQVEAEVRFRLRLEIELPLESPDLFRCLQAHRQSPRLLSVKSAPEVRVLPSAGITRHQRYYHPFRFPPAPPPEVTLRPLPSPATGLPRLPVSPSLRAVPTTPADRNGCIRRLLPRSTRPSPNLRRVGVHIFTFEACSGFTRVRPARSLNRPRWPLSQGFGPAGYPTKPPVSYQIKPTTVWVDPSSTGVTRRRGALRPTGLAYRA